MLLADVVVRDALSAERHEGCQRVGIDTIFGKPPLIQSNDIEQVAASRVSCHENLALTATIFLDVLVGPCHCCRGIVEDIVDLSFWQQAVVGSDDHQSTVLELWVDVFVAALDATTMEPHHDGCILQVCRGIDIKFAALLGIGVC